jgi:hypothetical protein
MRRATGTLDTSFPASRERFDTLVEFLGLGHEPFVVDGR